MSVTPIDVVAQLMKKVLSDLQLHPAGEPFSEGDRRKLSEDFRWRAAEEIVRLRGVIARNCDPSAAASSEDATVIEAAIRMSKR